MTNIKKCLKLHEMGHLTKMFKKEIFYYVLFIIVAILFCFGIEWCVNYQDIQQNVQFNVLIEGVVEIPQGNQYWIGSGVIVREDGIVVTARHCVEGADYIKVTLQDGQAFFVYSWLMDENRDIAVFPVLGEFKKVAVIGDSNFLGMGDIIYCVGNPEGIWENKVIKCEVEKNRFNRLAIGGGVEYIFVTGDIQSGCSGGGVYRNGKLIGIVSLGGQNIGFLVPVEEVIELLNEYNGVSF